jgi:hypothetical protein
MLRADLSPKSLHRGPYETPYCVDLDKLAVLIRPGVHKDWPHQPKPPHTVGAVAESS